MLYEVITKEIIDGTINALEKNKDIKVLLYGVEEEIKKLLPIIPERMTVINCAEVIETCEPPLIAIRKKTRITSYNVCYTKLLRLSGCLINYYKDNS